MRRQAVITGLTVWFKEFSEKGYALRDSFKRKFRDEVEAATAKNAWESGCYKASIALRGEVV